MKDRILIPDFLPNGPMGLKELKVPSDVLGSYTGNPKDDDKIPVQDADDL